MRRRSCVVRKERPSESSFFGQLDLPSVIVNELISEDGELKEIPPELLKRVKHEYSSTQSKKVLKQLTNDLASKQKQRNELSEELIKHQSCTPDLESLTSFSLDPKCKVTRIA